MFVPPYLLQIMNRLRELPVAASAVKFCSNLFREANRAELDAQQEADEAAGICHKVLTESWVQMMGQSGPRRRPTVPSPEGQHYQLGRLEKVNATEKAWKVITAKCLQR